MPFFQGLEGVTIAIHLSRIHAKTTMLVYPIHLRVQVTSHIVVIVEKDLLIKIVQNVRNKYSYGFNLKDFLIIPMIYDY